MRPLIAAEPMLRTPRPEIVAVSKRAAGASAALATVVVVVATRVARAKPRVCLRMAFAPYFAAAGAPAGNWKTVSSTAPLTSMRSSVIVWPFGPPFGPDSNENGMYTPATCS